MSDIIGIIGAMDVEVKKLQETMNNIKKYNIGEFVFYNGLLGGKKVIVAKSGIGKVNAALCTQILITKFEVTRVINTGIAGATGKGLEIFDFVASTETVYHDFDLRFFGCKKGQIPGRDLTFKADQYMADKALEVFNTTEFAKEHKIVKGRIASGDQFIADKKLKKSIINEFNPACVEMEGCAIAHACVANNIPFLILRCLSDCAEDTATDTYSFNEETAAEISSSVVLKLIELL